MLEGIDEFGLYARRGPALQAPAGRLGSARFRCSACGRSHWVDASSVYGLRSIPDGRLGKVFEGPCLICGACGAQMYREGDPRLRRPPGRSSAHANVPGAPPRRVPVSVKAVCDAVIATPESRIATLNLGSGEILYFSKRSRRLADVLRTDPRPSGRELDAWLESQPDDYARLPEIDGEERRALMRQFVRTLGDDRIRERLTRLTEGRRPLAAFRQGLSQHPWHEGRWLEYSRRYVAPLVGDWSRTAGVILQADSRSR